MDMDEKTNSGSLWMLDKGTLSKKKDDVMISNGICWNREASLMYYIDSNTKNVSNTTNWLNITNKHCLDNPI